VILAPKARQRVETSVPTRVAGVAHPAGRKGVIVEALGMLVRVEWQDSGEVMSINGAFLVESR